MDQISIAIEKARNLRREISQPPHEGGRAGLEPNSKANTANAGVHAPNAGAAPEITSLQLDPDRLEDSRLVSYSRQHPSHAAFDMLRTKIAHAMASNGWTSLAVTSPSPGCGKSVVALNLAFSMAHQPDRTVVLVDLDLRSPRLADLVGHKPEFGFADYLEGRVDLPALYKRASENLILCLNSRAVARSAEWIRSEKIAKLPARLKETLGAKIVIFDLPPALTADDVMAFCPYVDCAMLVAASGRTTAREIEESEKQLTLTNYLGVVLNKAFGSDIKVYSDSTYNKRMIDGVDRAGGPDREPQQT